MSGLLRRIKRSRAADAGEPLREGRAAAPDGALDGAGHPAGVAVPAAGTDATPAGAASPAAPPPRTDATAGAAMPDPASGQGTGSAGAAAVADGSPAAPDRGVLVPVADAPAGLDPVEGPVRPPAGRRGRLRRRLRYLRRARDLMLRDLGGLLFEVHRTGGGDVAAHGHVIDAKVQRIAAVDAEAHALEAALGAPRGDAVVFQPGVGGACAACGELYGGTARFCSHCGATTGAVPVAAPPPVAVGAPPPVSAAAPPPVAVEAPAPVPDPEPAPPAADAVTRADAPDAAPDREPPAEPPVNGRREGHTAQELRAGDPLAPERRP